MEDTMHKPFVLVFSLLLLPPSVSLVGMKREGVPQYVAPPSVLGFSASSPQRFEDNPNVRRRIGTQKKVIADLIIAINEGWRLPDYMKDGMLRKALICGLREEL